MRNLALTRHALEQYAYRTGRKPNDYTIEQLVNSIKNGIILTYEDTIANGFYVSKQAKNDFYIIWHDDKCKDDLLAIIAMDGAIKTVLRKTLPDGKLFKTAYLKRRENNNGKKRNRNKEM